MKAIRLVGGRVRFALRAALEHADGSMVTRSRPRFRDHGETIFGSCALALVRRSIITAAMPSTRIQRCIAFAALASLAAMVACNGGSGDEPTPAATTAPTATATQPPAATAAPATPTAAATQSGPTNQPPTASFTAEPNCTSSNSTEVTFTSTSTDPDGDELSHSWDIRSGNPSSATGQVVSGVTFPNIRPYPITLSVDDGRGGTDSATMNMGPC